MAGYIDRDHRRRDSLHNVGERIWRAGGSGGAKKGLTINGAAASCTPGDRPARDDKA
jgi:hypothetical protein